MHRNRRTHATMQLSRGLILGRIATGVRHLCLGLAAMSLVSLTLTGHIGMAILMVCVVYIVLKACRMVTSWLRGEQHATD